MKPITILDLAIHRGAKECRPGNYNVDELERVGLAIIGGCDTCGATISAYNAAPTKRGTWACAKDESCHGDQGYETVQEANFELFGNVSEDGDECLVCENGTVEVVDGEVRCMGECGTTTQVETVGEFAKNISTEPPKHEVLRSDVVRDRLLTALFGVAEDDEADVLTRLMLRAKILWKCKNEVSDTQTCGTEMYSDQTECHRCGAKKPFDLIDKIKEGVEASLLERADLDPDTCYVPTGKNGGYCGAPIGECEHTTKHK